MLVLTREIIDFHGTESNVLELHFLKQNYIQFSMIHNEDAK